MHNRGGLDIHWYVTFSKPSSEVIRVVNDLVQLKWETLPITVNEAPFSPLGGPAERFMELRQWQLDQAAMTDWSVIWDDDQVLERPRDVKQFLQDPDVDLVYATKTYFWNNDSTVALHFPTHRSVFFFRRRDGDRFPHDRTIHAPISVHDTPRKVVDLGGTLLDYGYMCKEDRQRCWLEYKRCGKIDPVTLGLIQENPPTRIWPGPFPLRGRHHD